jgi:predicted cupin superfamily sugar epimerase
VSEADRIIAALDLEPHPEGGWYRETFRDAPGPDGRARSTAIYFLLKAGERSRWHRVDAVEIWHWHAGAPLDLKISDDLGPIETVRLGPDLSAGQRPQAVVPTLIWQSARSTGDFTLVGCTVAPGFAFSGFELAPEGFEPGCAVPVPPD